MPVRNISSVITAMFQHKTMKRIYTCMVYDHEARQAYMATLIGIKMFNSLKADQTCTYI